MNIQVSTCKELLKLLYSGTKATGIIGAYWFIPVLFFTELANYFLQKVSNRTIRIVILLIRYVVFQFALKNINLPMNLNIVPIALVFFSIGVSLKGNWHYRVVISKLSITILIVFILFYSLNLTDFKC
ncbi:hypothetical protein BCR23_12680 [Enterococcus quebecensis]|uniref:Uncharacterized protein n=1 Tax=Enterococcus quebecensis TaxID=903983 RepID=A0A1E5GPQ6_9ENTE|nr:hypothetical protein BCR23_12680 [Enterococcus quebecensis]